MPKITTSEVVDPRLLSSLMRKNLLEALYAVHCQIFDGVDIKEFAKDVVNSNAERTFIVLHKNSLGEIVGYCATHFFDQLLYNKPSSILRVEAGLLKEYRGQNSNITHIIRQVLRYRMSRPFRPFYYLEALVHPSSYLLLSKYSDQIWPHYRHVIQKDMSSFLAQMNKSFGLTPVNRENPAIVHVGWQTRDTEQDRHFWTNSKNEVIRFYVEQNPGYERGHGLLTLVSITAGSTLRAVGILLRDSAKRHCTRFLPRRAFRRLTKTNFDDL